MQKLLFLGCVTLIIGACSTPYPCGEPGTGQCKSVSQNYDQSYQSYTNPDDLNADGSNAQGSQKSGDMVSDYLHFQEYPAIPADGAPLLSAPKMMRVWLSPYTDSDNIFHDQSYEYIIVSRGTWNYNNNKVLFAEDNLQNVTPAQVSNVRHGGYGAYGNLDQPVKSESAVSIPSSFPALSSLQNNQVPVVTTTIGSGIDRTTRVIGN